MEGKDGSTSLASSTSTPLTQPYVMTALGPVKPSTVGQTLMHEHLIANLINPFYLPPETEEDKVLSEQPLQLSNLHWVNYHVRKSKPNLILDSVETAVYELNLFAKAGGNTVVDVTPVGIGRNVRALHQIAEELKGTVQVVCGTAFYVDDTHPESVTTSTQKDIQDFMLKEINEGIEGTDIKAGIIGEIGTSYPLTDNETKILKGAAIAALRSGVCLSIHPGRHIDAPFKIIELLHQAVSAESTSGEGDALMKTLLPRTVMCHIDRTFSDIDIMVRLAQTGIVLEFDLFGMECSNYPWGTVTMPSDQQRIEWIHTLIQKGYRDQIVVGHDVYSKHRLTLYGGHGYRHLLHNLAPRMLRAGMTPEDLEAIFVINPRRLLTITPPAHNKA